jgi:hypothetical protein
VKYNTYLLPLRNRKRARETAARGYLRTELRARRALGFKRVCSEWERKGSVGTVTCVRNYGRTIDKQCAWIWETQ